MTHVEEIEMLQARFGLEPRDAYTISHNCRRSGKLSLIDYAERVLESRALRSAGLIRTKRRTKRGQVPKQMVPTTSTVIKLYEGRWVEASHDEVSQYVNSGYVQL